MRVSDHFPLLSPLSFHVVILTLTAPLRPVHPFQLPTSRRHSETLYLRALRSLSQNRYQKLLSDITFIQTDIHGLSPFLRPGLKISFVLQPNPQSASRACIHRTRVQVENNWNRVRPRRKVIWHFNWTILRHVAPKIDVSKIWRTR